MLNICFCTDSESECPVSEVSFPSSASLFRLDLNLEDSTVHISRPLQTSTNHTKKGKPNSGKHIRCPLLIVSLKIYFQSSVV